MYRLIIGALSGLAATVPMTLAMEAMHRYLPSREQHPLPPRLIIDEVVEEAGVDRQLDEEDRQRLTWVGHFSYGAAAGALYAPLAGGVGLPAVADGVLYGLMVWTGSYLGLLPAAGILRPATQHPARRTALMIAAHVVWGATLGTLVGHSDKPIGR
jgi:uncharacterized membrane protein YagU involved in acid resistance